MHAAHLHDVSEHEVVDAVLDRDDEDDYELANDHHERRGHAGVWITLVVVCAIFGLGIAGFMHLVYGADESGPAAGSGEEAIKQSIAPTPSTLPSLSGQYISFSYPQVFDSVKTLNNWPTTLERYAIGSTADYRRSIEVYVEKNTPTLNDDSGYQYRNESGSGYHAEAIKVAQEPAMVMVKNDNTEQTLYWEHSGILVVISVTSTTGTDDVSAFLGVIEGSLRWVAA